tara:strand:+ start:2360 stop:2578 length:219 start_codon:yes stop_codon:yes gene_type:complete
MHYTEEQMKYNYQESCKQWLAETDWTTLSDVNLTPENKAEWVAWRAIVRSQLIDWDKDREMPPRPMEKWITE